MSTAEQTAVATGPVNGTSGTEDVQIELTADPAYAPTPPDGPAKAAPRGNATAATTERSVRERYSARPLGKAWGVYDVLRGSWPVQRPDIGTVVQETSQDEAVKQAASLNQSATTARSAW